MKPVTGMFWIALVIMQLMLLLGFGNWAFTGSPIHTATGVWVPLGGEPLTDAEFDEYFNGPYPEDPEPGQFAEFDGENIVWVDITCSDPISSNCDAVTWVPDPFALLPHDPPRGTMAIYIDGQWISAYE